MKPMRRTFTALSPPPTPTKFSRLASVLASRSRIPFSSSFSNRPFSTRICQNWPKHTGLSRCPESVSIFRRSYAKLRRRPGWNLHTEEYIERRFAGTDMVRTLLIVNGAVFGGWLLLPQDFMHQHFVISLKNVQEGRVWTLVTSAFSHKDMFHLLFNGMGLWVMGRPVMHVLGPYRFLTLYLVAGVCSSLCHLVYTNVIKPRMISNSHATYLYNKAVAPYQGALGMSGSVMCMSVLYGALFPYSVLLLYGIIPVRAPVLAGLFVAYDLFNSFYDPASAISHPGHLGGALCGLLYYYVAIRRRLGR